MGLNPQSRSTRKLYFVDDDSAVRSSAAEALDLAGFDVECFSSAPSAIRGLASCVPAVLVSDIRLPGVDGFGLLREAHALAPQLPVILITAHGDVPTAVRAMREGAHYFIEKPFPIELLIDTAQRAIEHHQLRSERDELLKEVRQIHADEASLLGNSPAIEWVRRQIAAYAGTAVDVLLVGECGTGKALAARMIHDMSDRRHARMVCVHCGTGTHTALKSEFFGHELGAFPGAYAAQVGKFELAQGGSLLLEHVEQLPPPTQAQIVRAMQERAIEKLGSNELTPIDVRLIASTSSDLGELTRQGYFRDDLLQHLNIAVVRLPPLRERREDIPGLLEHLLAKAAVRLQRPLPCLDEKQVRELASHHWPGNMHELQTAAERLMLGLAPCSIRAMAASPCRRST